ILRAFRIPTFAMLSRMESQRDYSASTSERTRIRRPARSAWRPSKPSDESSRASTDNIRTASKIGYFAGGLTDQFSRSLDRNIATSAATPAASAALSEYGLTGLITGVVR